jgi:Beta-lactamase
MNRKQCILVVISVLLMAMTAAVAQELTAAKPESVGLSSERQERIGVAVQRTIDDQRIAGAVTFVSRRGRVAWFKAQGMSDREAGKPMRPDTMFRICSMTKEAALFVQDHRGNAAGRSRLEVSSGIQESESPGQASIGGTLLDPGHARNYNS